MGARDPMCLKVGPPLYNGPLFLTIVSLCVCVCVLKQWLSRVLSRASPAPSLHLFGVMFTFLVFMQFFLPTNHSVSAVNC